MRELTLYLGYEATTEITLKPRVVEGSLGPVEGQKLSDKIAIVPILRGGLGMVDAMTEILPNAAVYHVGMFSNHRSLSLPIQYYNRLPKEKDKVADLTFVLDPLIATAGTCSATVSILKKWGTKKIIVIGVVGALQGLHKLTQAHSDIRVHVAAIDEAVSADGHILPGIGDASERLFNAHVGEPDDETYVLNLCATKKTKRSDNGCWSLTVILIKLSEVICFTTVLYNHLHKAKMVDSDYWVGAYAVQSDRTRALEESKGIEGSMEKSKCKSD